jgi:hypothetical protein
MSTDDEVAISHLQKRKIEGRVLLPFIQTLIEKIGREAALEILDATINNLRFRTGTTGRLSSEAILDLFVASRRRYGAAAGAWKWTSWMLPTPIFRSM